MYAYSSLLVENGSLVNTWPRNMALEFKMEAKYMCVDFRRGINIIIQCTRASFEGHVRRL